MAFECKEGAGLPGAFRVGSAISLKPVGADADMKAIGVWPARVMKVRGMELEVVLEGDGPEGIAVQHITWTVEARADERSFNAMRMPESLGRMWRMRSGCDYEIWSWVLRNGRHNRHSRSWARGCCRIECPTDLRGKGHVLSSTPCASARPARNGKTRTLVAGMRALVSSGQRVLHQHPRTWLWT